EGTASLSQLSSASNQFTAGVIKGDPAVSSQASTAISADTAAAAAAAKSSVWSAVNGSSTVTTSRRRSATNGTAGNDKNTVTNPADVSSTSSLGASLATAAPQCKVAKMETQPTDDNR
ncbi:unnamed protein product, partial [Anisakis simplex]|uniref:Serum resistance protein n=1 Tax=Anisakis simplex TaxID=6269 RepID=A0A0M3JK37_ANISI